MTATDTAAEPVTGEIALRPASVAMEEYRPRIVMAPDEAAALDQSLRDMMRAILRENVDFGVIPGTNKPSLYKPGAEKLLQWFGFGHTMEQVETERGSASEWLGVTYRCTVTKGLADGRTVTVATCEGYAGYDEERFFLSAEAATAKERANAERYHRQVNPSKCVEYRAPRNSVVKMAQKRALVGAALQATSASTLFTQDVEDNADPGVSAAASIASAASDVIASLPEEARRGVDTWRREQGWPKPGDWDAAQWCGALVQAGRIAEQGEFAKRGVEIVKPPAEDAWATPEGGGDWVTTATEQARTLTSKDAGRTLYAQAVAKMQAGEITAAQKDEICGLITAQMEFLNGQAGAVEGTVAAPDGDPWQDAIAAMTTREDALALLDKLEKARGGVVDERRYKGLKVAIRTKADGLPSAPGEAA